MEFLLLVAGIVVLVGGAILIARGGLLAGCLAVVVAGICFGHPFFNLPVGPLPLTVDRLLLGALLVLYVVYRRLGMVDAKPLMAADYVLGAFLAVVLASTLTHDWHIKNSQPLAYVVFFYLMPLALYWVARQCRLRAGGLTAMFAAAGIFGLYLSLTAIAETHQMWALVYPSYIGSAQFVEFFGRGRGPLLNPAGSGLLQALCFCGALMCWPRLHRWGQLALLGLTPIYAWGIYSTMTRSAWLGAALGLAVVLSLTLPKIWRMPVLGGSLVLSLALVAGNWEHFVSFKRDKDLSAAEAAESARLRPILAVVAWNMFLDRPLLGCGYGQYALECRPYLADRSGDLPLEKARPYVQHNVLLALLAETGLLGMGLFLALLTLWTRNAWRLWHKLDAPLAVRQCGLLFLALVGIYLPNAMLQDMSIVAMVNTLLFFLAGLTVNLAWTSGAMALSCAVPARRWSCITPVRGTS